MESLLIYFLLGRYIIDNPRRLDMVQLIANDGDSMYAFIGDDALFMFAFCGGKMGHFYEYDCIYSMYFDDFTSMIDIFRINHISFRVTTMRQI